MRIFRTTERDMSYIETSIAAHMPQFPSQWISICEIGMANSGPA